MDTPLFRSFFLGGFECSTHRRRDGRRLDVIQSTRHDELAGRDYQLLQRYGINAARDGFRWHLIESASGRYDFSSALGMLEAARDAEMQVIWDLWHYGWPDHLDIFSAAFVDGFTAFAREAIKHVSDHTERPLISPINEISFFSWAGGEAGFFNPFAHHRGDELKRQLVRASIQAIEAMREINPAVRIVQVDPIINVVPRSANSDDVRNAEAYRGSQFEAWDLITGRAEPGLGGRDALIDVIGVNYYIHNQFIWGGGLIVPSDPRYRHVSAMLQETYARYRRPIFIAETGIEDASRPAWLRYITKEAFMAMAAGVPVEGICLYPILNHPGWDDDRHCHNGLFDYADATGRREVYQPLADEVSRLSASAAALRVALAGLYGIDDLETSALDWAAHVMEERTEESRTEADRPEESRGEEESRAEEGRAEEGRAEAPGRGVPAPRRGLPSDGRRTSMGSARVARRAGMTHDAKATATRPVVQAGFLNVFTKWMTVQTSSFENPSDFTAGIFGDLRPFQIL